MQGRWFANAMQQANRLLHIFIALALLVASLLLIWQFLADVVHTVASRQVARGFLQALGNLFILWVLSSLISAEVRYMRTGRFGVSVFIEVALITLLRELIIIPVESQGHLKEWTWTYGMIIAAVVAVSLAFFLIHRSRPGGGESSLAGETPASDPEEPPADS